VACQLLFDSVLKMTSEKLIVKTEFYVRNILHNAEGGHDWWHIYRVWQNAKLIAREEKVNLLVVELAALLHDIADSKFHAGDETIGPKLASQFLVSNAVDPETISQVQQIITDISFKSSFSQIKSKSIELHVVQDADRLDAMGAIGIARAFNFGGYKNREIYNPNIPPNFNQTSEEYKNSKGPTLNHFYEKLLRLKDLFNTDTGKKLAEHRHEFMVTYLAEFFAEWEVK